MIDISGHLRAYRDEMGFEDVSDSLIINCCGCQKFIEEDYTRMRPNGRKDYQIIYIHKGKGHFKIRNEELILGAGSIIFYKPHEPQIYSYYGKERPEVYWIHFTGAECSDLMKHFEFAHTYIGESMQIKNLFHDMILELQLQKLFYMDIINSSFIKLISLIQRAAVLNETTTENHFAIDRLIILLNQDYMKQWTISDMAQFCNLSNDYFSHIFKEAMHVSPMKFLTDLRIAKSKELLVGEGQSIADVAFLVGYSDPLYFSRVFKKHEKLSPKQYREEILALQTPFATQ